MSSSAESLPPPPRGSHVHEVRVFYGDTDQMGVAYYANYLRWFEMARNEFLRAVGIPYSQLESAGYVLPVVEAHCRYQSPARYDDLLQVEAWIAERGRAKVRFSYRVRRRGEPNPLAIGYTVHACLDRDSTPRRLPPSLIAALQRFEGLA